METPIILFIFHISLFKQVLSPSTSPLLLPHPSPLPLGFLSPINYESATLRDVERPLSERSGERKGGYSQRSQVDAVVLLHFAHDEGAFDGADGVDVAEFVEYELLVLLHVACAYL